MAHAVITEIGAAADIIGAKPAQAVGDGLIHRVRAHFIIGLPLRIGDDAADNGTRRKPGNAGPDGRATMGPFASVMARRAIMAAVLDRGGTERGGRSGRDPRIEPQRLRGGFLRGDGHKTHEPHCDGCDFDLHHWIAPAFEMCIIWSQRIFGPEGCMDRQAALSSPEQTEDAGRAGIGHPFVQARTWQDNRARARVQGLGRSLEHHVAICSAAVMDGKPP